MQPYPQQLLRIGLFYTFSLFSSISAPCCFLSCIAAPAFFAKKVETNAQKPVHLFVYYCFSFQKRIFIFKNCCLFPRF